MIDLETLGVRPGCVIASIGLVIFNEKENVFTQKFNINVCTQAGLRIEPQTMLWWMQQSNEAKAATFASTLRENLRTALEQLSTFLKSYDVKLVWSKPATFDIPILEYAYNSQGLPIPWGHRDIRCLRTLWAHYNLELLDFVGTPHDCLADAVNQVNCLRVIFNHVRQNNNKIEDYDELKKTLDASRLKIEELKQEIRGLEETILAQGIMLLKENQQ